jgi:MFS family permease
MPDSPISSVARVIQLAVAPVFLLTALGTLLGVFSTRLGRVVDRARRLIERLRDLPEAEQAQTRAELHVLLRRRKLVNSAIGFATGAALMVCLLISVAFIGSVLGKDPSHWVASLFVVAMIAFTGALLSFLAEVLLASWTNRFEPPQ